MEVLHTCANTRFSGHGSSVALSVGASSAATARMMDCRELMGDQIHLGVLCGVDGDIGDVAFCLGARVAGSDVCVLRQG